MGGRRGLVLGAALAFMMAACANAAISQSPVILVPLPESPAWRGGCGIGVGVDAVLRGSVADPRVTWATDRQSNHRLELLWPVGYEAWFAPRLVLLDEHGIVVGREGDLIIGICSLPTPADDDAARVSASDIRPSTWDGDG